MKRLTKAGDMLLSKEKCYSKGSHETVRGVMPLYFTAIVSDAIN